MTDVDPLAVEDTYERPLDIVSDGSLDPGEKVSLLRRWDELVQSRIRSSGEGMTERADDAPSGDAALSEQIAQALRMLDAVDAASRTAPSPTTGVAAHSRASD